MSRALIRLAPCGCVVDIEAYDFSEAEPDQWTAPNGDTMRVLPAALAESVERVCRGHRVRPAVAVQGGLFE